MFGTTSVWYTRTQVPSSLDRKNCKKPSLFPKKSLSSRCFPWIYKKIISFPLSPATSSPLTISFPAALFPLSSVKSLTTVWFLEPMICPKLICFLPMNSHLFLLSTSKSSKSIGCCTSKWYSTMKVLLKSGFKLSFIISVVPA